MLLSRRTLSIVLATLLLGAITVGAVATLPTMVSKLSYAAEKGQAAAAREQLALVDDLSQAFRHVSKAMRPSVVTITSVKKVQVAPRQRRSLPRGFEEFFGNEDFFDRFFEFPAPGRNFEEKGLGSGFVVSADGYILTNSHVVRGADEVDVALSDNRTFRAEIVGTDDSTDIAVLKIDATGLAPAKLGDSEAIDVGQWVLAIGSPFGLDQTVTAGIISGKNRSNVNITDYEDFIQTDAAINVGNSGGPLVNLRGEVIGINTAIASRTGVNMGVGFAIPSNMARTVMDSIMRQGKVVRGFIGAQIQDVDENAAEFFKYNSREGVLIGDLTPGGPAAKAGLKADDIVRSYNGKAVRNKDELRNAVAATKPGTPVEVTVFRDGKDQKMTIVVGELNQEAVARATGRVATDELGVTVQSLTPDLAQRLGLDSNARGVVVTETAPDGPAARVEIRPGDLIIMVNRSTVRNLAEYREAIKQANVSEGVRLVVIREGVRRSVFVPSNR